jgi:hypothetical protein
MKTYVFFHMADDDFIREEQIVNFAPHEAHATDLPSGIAHRFLFLIFLFFYRNNINVI